MNNNISCKKSLRHILIAFVILVAIQLFLKYIYQTNTYGVLVYQSIEALLVMGLIHYVFCKIKKDSWIDKEMKESRKKDKNNTI